jgi:Rrf2 family protein
MRLSRTTTYAIQAVLALAESPPGVAVPCSQIARAGHLPERFLVHILRALVKHGLLRSSRGIEGGYSLARPPDQITLFDLIKTFDNSFATHLPLLEGQSPSVRERLLEALLRISRAADNELRKVTVAELLNRDSTNGVPRSN